MQIHTEINDHLFNQAVLLTGVADQRLLLESALRLLIQPNTLANNNAKHPESHFAEKLQCFRAVADLSDFADIDCLFANVRDDSPGREVAL